MSFLLHVTGTLRIAGVGQLENLSYDSRLELMLTKPDTQHVTIIDIDERSLTEIGHWPWNRNILAGLTDALFDHYQVRVLGFDVVFAEEDIDESATLLHNMAAGPLNNNPGFQAAYTQALPAIQRDARFARSLKNRDTVLGFVMDTDTRTGILPVPILSIDNPVLDSIPFLEATGYTGNLEVLQAQAASAGFFDNPLLDSDGVYRRTTLLQRHHKKLYASLALALTHSALGSPGIELIVSSPGNTVEGITLEWLKIGSFVIPVDEQAGALVPYIGKQRSFDYVAAVDILNKTAPVDRLRGKIVLLGSSAPGLRDLRTTPLEAAAPGVEIHANIIQGMLDRTVLHQPGYTIALEFLLVLVLGLGLTLLLPLLSPAWGLAASTTLLLLIITVNLAAWTSLQLVLPLASPLLLVICMYVLHMSYGFFVENRNRRKLARLFSQYVPPDLVAEISSKMEDIRLDGEIRNMTVLFSDVRDFTAIAERLEPEQITRLMNAFLTPITETIHRHRGTIDKYMGDAVMAFWGAPLEDTRHAFHAVTAATDIVSKLQSLKPEFAENGWPEIRIGIGINSGDMNVGNKGSRFRVDYTVLGDAVNLGSRLENLTKYYGVEIIAGESTRHAVPEFTFRELDSVRVKGRDRPVRIYQPLGLAGTIVDTVHRNLEKYHQALMHYRRRQWDDAEQLLRPLNREDPQCRIYRIFLDRIDHFRQQPPADDWDGTWSHDSTE